MKLISGEVAVTPDFFFFLLVSIVLHNIDNAEAMGAGQDPEDNAGHSGIGRPAV